MQLNKSVIPGLLKVILGALILHLCQIGTFLCYWWFTYGPPLQSVLTKLSTYVHPQEMSILSQCFLLCDRCDVWEIGIDEPSCHLNFEFKSPLLIITPQLCHKSNDPRPFWLSTEPSYNILAMRGKMVGRLDIRPKSSTWPVGVFVLVVAHLYKHKQQANARQAYSSWIPVWKLWYSTYFIDYLKSVNGKGSIFAELF